MKDLSPKQTQSHSSTLYIPNSSMSHLPSHAFTQEPCTQPFSTAFTPQWLSEWLRLFLRVLIGGRKRGWSEHMNIHTAHANMLVA